MNGLLRRLTRRRAAPADENPAGTPGASEPVDATVISLEEGAPMSEEQRELLAREEELRRRRRDLPAGVDPEQLEAKTSEGSRRGALRRRVRYLRRVRELLLRDLGGFYYEVHRSAGTTHGGHRDILETKAARLDAVDQELRELETRLGEPFSGQTVLREPGIGGTCPNCGELHASDAGWCAHCGTPLTERARRRAEQDVDREIAARREREAGRARAAAVATAEGAGGASNGEAATGNARTTARHDSGGAPTTDGEAVTGDAATTALPESGEAPTSELPAGGEEDAGTTDDGATVGERGR